MATTKRLPVGIGFVNWHDGQRIIEEDVEADQNRNTSIDAANVANFMGSGILRSDSEPIVILDTNSLNDTQEALFDSYAFDGQDVYIGSVNDVSDSIKGVQLSVTLSDVDLSGSETTRVCIIGDTFGDSLIFDALTFEENGTQVTRGRYKSIRGILFQDFFGNLRGSRSPAADDGYNKTGRCIIREVEALECSIDPIIASQTNQPNKFFEDFNPALNSDTITTMLETAIGADKSISDMEIGIETFAQRELAVNDVTKKIGQKFLANGTNIQKISVLLSVQQDTAALPADAYNWSGSIALTLHALQTDVDCPTDPIPDNTVAFDPEPAIIGQITLDSDDMEKQGIVLDGYSRKVDFVFTGTNLSDPSRTPIELNRYYVLTISRTGDASVGTLLVEEAPHRADNGYMTIFDGTSWINVKTSDLWFSVEGDYIKISDGVAYEDGVGVEVLKIAPDATNTEAPYIEGLIEFSTVTKDAYNYTLLESSTAFSDQVEDERTGVPVYTRATPSPEFSILTQSNLNTLLETDLTPVLLCRVKDQNPRGNPLSLTGTTNSIGLALDNEFNILEPNADLQQHNLVGSLLYPNSSLSANYRIIKTTLISDAYGDVNGDGEIDSDDLALALALDGYDITATATQQLIAGGYIDLLEFLRADVNGDGAVNSTDVGLISGYIDGSVASFPAGSTFSRLKIDIENTTDPLVSGADIDGSDASFITAPFSPVDWSIQYCASWLPDRVVFEDLRRFLPTTFTETLSTEHPGGQNNFYVPGDLIIDGYQLNRDGTYYSVDLEVNHLSLDVPVMDSYGNPTFIDGYTGILLFDTFVAESSGGKTASGFNAMKYADGTYVQIADYTSEKVKIAPAIQSTAHTFPVTAGGNIEDIVGMHYDVSSSLVTLYLNNLYDDGYGNILPPVNTKLLVTVYLKKAGFRNETQFITKDQMKTLLNI